MSVINSVNKKSIAIVGSGLSGLTAACLLHKLGFSVTVFEAAPDRIGGRIFSVWEGRTQLALGAMWLHGGSGNPLYPLVKRLGLLDPEVWQQRQDNLPDLCDQSSTYQYDWTQCACVTDSGQPVDCSDIRQAEQTIRQHLADVYNLPPSVLKDAYSDRMGAYVESKLPMDADSTIYGSALKTFALFYANVEGVHSLNDLSIVGGSDYTCPDGQCLVAGGMVGLIDALADRLPDNCVRLNSRVDRISLTPDGAVSLLIDSQWQQFDHALVTVSLGVLQANQLIEPSLVTNERQSALKQMQLGVVDKIFVRLAAPVPLPVDCNHLWIVRQQLCNTWVDGVFSLSVVNKDRDIIMFWIAGDYAKSMEVKSEAELIEDLTKQLEGVFRCAVPEILEIIRSAFGSKQNFLGSYSHFLPGSNPELHSALWDPIKYSASDKPAVCFAGEHTHPCYFSTVHGALLSGVREAVRISQYCKLSVKSSSSTADKFLDSLVQLVSN